MTSHSLQQSSTLIHALRLRNLIFNMLEGIDENQYAQLLSLDPIEAFQLKEMAGTEPDDYNPEREATRRFSIRKYINRLRDSAVLLEENKAYVVHNPSLTIHNMYMNYMDDLKNIEKILRNIKQQYPKFIERNTDVLLRTTIHNARRAAQAEFGQHYNITFDTIPPEKLAR